jgi:hypothetical protein
MSSPAADATDAADAAADLLSLFEGAQPTPQAGAPSAVVAIATTTPAALSNDLTVALVPDAGPIANPPACSARIILSYGKIPKCWDFYPRT